MKYISYLFVFFASSLLYTADSVSIDLATTEEERSQIGISSMTDTQKAAFEKWLGSWTHRVIQAAPSFHPALSLNQWVQDWPKYLQVNTPPNDKQAAKEEKQELSTIFRNIDGERLILKNGSEWEIDPPDRFNTRFWVRDTLIHIKYIGESLTRSYSLTNTLTNEIAGAKQIKAPTTAPQDSTSYFRGTFQLHGITATGDEIRLMNNSKWKIAPVDQKKVVTTWKQHDRIRIQESGDAIWPYTLNNLDSGSTAIAIKK